MITNYFITAIRAIKKDKQHFLLNLIGFSIGIAAAILMALFAQHELSYDKHQPDSERVYLAHADYTSVGLQIIASSSYRVADVMKNHSQVEDIFKLTESGSLTQNINDLVQIEDNYYRLSHFYAATSNILDFIQLDVVAGDIKLALSQPDQLALSEKEANRIFGTVKVIGRTLKHDQGQYRVGAVFKNLPENTHVKFDTLIQMPAQYVQEGHGYAYYKLLANTDMPRFEKEFTDELHKSRNIGRESTVTMALINMEDMHLNSSGPFFMKKGGSSSILQICIGLSFILILVVSINFINLNIAQSAKRAKEVGVRKALGATKIQLVTQFLTESFLIVSMAALIAVAMVEISLPAFNQMMDRQLNLIYGSEFMLVTIVVILVVGLLSGLYPALFIASFSAKRVLSGDLVRGGTAVFVRKLTLCLQGALSVGLIIAAISLFQQMSLINSLEVGYAKSSRLVIKDLPTEALYTKEHNSLLAVIRDLPGVEQVTLSNTDLTNDMEYDFGFTWPNGERIDGFQPTVGTGYHAVEALGLTLLAGRDFSEKFSDDWYKIDEERNRTLGVLVSRRMAELAGYQTPESAVGLTLREPRYNLTAKVVGVIENVKIGSVRQQSLPMSFNLGFNSNATGHIIIKASSNMAELSKLVEKVVRQKLHLSDVQISLVAQDYANVHQNETRVLEMVTIFSILAIFLTCLGIFGLASFSALRRQKEIAIRKVLGASRLSLVNLIAKEFLLLISVSIALAFPMTYWLVGDWLANFNERVDQTIWVYLISAIIITTITWFTVASLALKAASTRPSLILRDE